MPYLPKSSGNSANDPPSSCSIGLKLVGIPGLTPKTHPRSLTYRPILNPSGIANIRAVHAAAWFMEKIGMERMAIPTVIIGCILLKIDYPALFILVALKTEQTIH
jgi:hypothetical protein